MDRFSRPIIATYALFAGTLGGFFFAFTNPTMQGFANTDPHTYVDAMNQINFAVRNPYFFVLFFMTPVLGVLAAIVSRANLWIVAAGLASLASFFITSQVNVPMNHLMENWVPGAYPPAAEIEQFRLDWMFYNTLRTVLTIGAAATTLIYLTCAPQRQMQEVSQYPQARPAHP